MTFLDLKMLSHHLISDTLGAKVPPFFMNYIQSRLSVIITSKNWHTEPNSRELFMLSPVIFLLAMLKSAESLNYPCGKAIIF